MTISSHIRLYFQKYFLKIRAKFLKFSLSGFFVTFLHIFLVFVIVEKNFLNPISANIIAFLISTITGYFLNTFWSFKFKPTRINLLKYFLVVFLNLTIVTIISSIFFFYNIHYLFSLLCIVILLPSVTFLIHFNWTYK